MLVWPARPNLPISDMAISRRCEKLCLAGQTIDMHACEGQPLWPRPLICTGPTHSEGHLSQQVLAGDEGLTRELVDKELTKGKGAAWGACTNGAYV